MELKLKDRPSSLVVPTYEDLINGTIQGMYSGNNNKELSLYFKIKGELIWFKVKPLRTKNDKIEPCVYIESDFALYYEELFTKSNYEKALYVLNKLLKGSEM